MDSPEHPHTHPKHTGRRWVDMIVAFSALGVSVLSIFVAVHHGETMEKLVEAQSWPYVNLDNSNVRNGRTEIALTIRNAGSGPAQIESLALTFAGRSVRNWPELMRACCTASTASDKQLLTATDGAVVTGIPANQVLLPGDVSTVIALPRTVNNETLWRRFNDQRFKVRAETCYCSVFDECYVARSGEGRPKHVKVCPTNVQQWQ